MTRAEWDLENAKREAEEKIEHMMDETLEMARETSKDNWCTVWAMSNGKNILICLTEDQRRWTESKGYWLCSIFEDGHMIDF